MFNDGFMPQVHASVSYKVCLVTASVHPQNHSLQQ